MLGSTQMFAHRNFPFAGSCCLQPFSLLQVIYSNEWLHFLPIKCETRIKKKAAARLITYGLFCCCMMDICTAWYVQLLLVWSSHIYHDTTFRKYHILSKTHLQCSFLHNCHSKCHHVHPHPLQQCPLPPSQVGEAALTSWPVVQLHAAAHDNTRV